LKITTIFELPLKILLMDNLRTHGSEPYDLVLLHGGPGAPGSLETIARRLSISFGILEPSLLSLSVEGQLEDLHSIVKKHSTKPLFFIGHSWGAWLSYLYAYRYPDFVIKVIMIGAPPFEEKYVPLIEETRFSRLTEKEKKDFVIAGEQLVGLSSGAESLSPEFIALLSKTDIFEVLPDVTIASKFYPAVYKSVWSEASQIRSSGKLLEYSKDIKCPVVAIHGDFDPHPAEGVKVPLNEALANFQFTLIEKCGHYPWLEKYGKDILYKKFYREMGSTCV
jgi:pimeloyl-ACP methyl ester carboxylesterase